MTDTPQGYPPPEGSPGGQQPPPQSPQPSYQPQPAQTPPAYPGPGMSDPNKPGSKSWIEQRYGRVAEFVDRIVPYLVDGLLQIAAVFIPLCLGGVLIGAGAPDSYDCGVYDTESCSVSGSGSGVLVGLGIFAIFLAFAASFAVLLWNRVWRVTKTGQSLGKKMTGLKVIDAETGEHPAFGKMVLRELINYFAGVISWVWIFVDDDDRTLADIVGKTHVVHVDKS